MRRGVKTADVPHQLFLAAFTMVIDLDAVTFIQNINVETAIVGSIFKKELNDPFAGIAVNHRRQWRLIRLDFNRQAVKLVVGNGAIKLNGVFQLLNRYAHAFKEQPPGLARHTQCFEPPWLLTRTGKAQFDAL